MKSRGRPSWSILAPQLATKNGNSCNDGNAVQLEAEMMTRKSNRILGVLALTLVFFLAGLVAMQSRSRAAAGASDYIEGVVTSSKGPEAGVWVIAETSDLPTKYAKIAVTDDQGRYALPELPKATYQVFVRGYGLVDSARVSAKPGQHLDLKAVVAPDGRAAAQVYPANYWLSLMEIPKGDVSDKDVLLETKACYSCHQVGDLVTRDISRNLGSYTSSLDAWDHHVSLGPNGPGMTANFKRMGAQRKAYADWTDRIAAGAYPEAPPRPAGVERNLVISMWDWALPTSRRTDVAADDERERAGLRIHPKLRHHCRARSTREQSDRDQAPVQRSTNRHGYAGVSVLGDRKDLGAICRPSQRGDGQP